MGRFSIFDTSLEGLKVIERSSLEDDRGFLVRLFCAEELGQAGWGKSIAQINHTYTKQKGVVRGMHFQKPPYAEIKLVSCLQGEIWDVAVDLRKNSPTFLKWHGEKLTSKNHRALLIPEGFAHGFQTLTDHCELMYLHSAPYVNESEAGIQPNDPAIAITWPLPIQDLSKRDMGHPMIGAQFKGIEL